MNKHSLFTSNSKSIKWFVIKLFLAFAVMIGYVNHVLPQYEQGYNAALIDKMERLKSINEPKIVLIGNSNLAFGIDSKMIEEEMGMPVVNMGLHGGNGNAFHEEMAKCNVVPGDIYVLCHNDFNDDNQIPNTESVWASIENHFGLWELLRKEDIEIMCRSFPTYFKKCLALYSSGTGNLDPGGVYSRKAFNEYGDDAVLREGSYYTFETNVGPSTIGDVTVNRINELNRFLEDKGATLLVAGCQYGNGCLTADARSYISFQNELIQRLDCPVISNYEDYLFDYKYFYDTYAHLTTEGVGLRTAQLIMDLKRWKETNTDNCPNEDAYIDIVADDNLSRITDIYDYLDALIAAKERYTIILSVKDDASGSLDDKIYEKLKVLGVSEALRNEYGFSYLSVIEQGDALCEKCGHEMLYRSGTFDHDRMKYTVVSGGYDRGNCSSIMLNGQEYSENVRGLNFVIYSNETHRILDEVGFDTCSEELTATR